MGSAFRRAAGGAVSASFLVVEVDLLRSLIAQLVDLFGHSEEEPGESDAQDDPLGLDGPLERPDDPVLMRLFPDAYADDAEAAGDFRRYTERGLRSKKSADAAIVLETLQSLDAQAGDDAKTKIVLDAEQAAAWLRTLTDLRLALGTRLGIEQDDDDRWDSMPEDDPRRYVHDIYDWLGWLQETLVRAVASRLR